MDINKQHQIATKETAQNLKTVAASPEIRETSHLSLPEIEAVSNLVAQVIPAGNVPGVILSGLVRLSGAAIPRKFLKRDIDLIFQGVEQTLDKAVYSAVFAGPAAVIWGYQSLLKLAGRSPGDAFPEGVWQFYIEYALRDDTARHTNETHGFDTALRQNQIQLTHTDRLTSWVMAAIHLLHQYDSILENEWRERIYIRLLKDVTADHISKNRYARIYRAWQPHIPYRRGSDADPSETYSQYRRRKFDSFLQSMTVELPLAFREAWYAQIRATEREKLPAYQDQMSILAYLEPGLYGENIVHVPLTKLQIGLIYRGHYYLLPICTPGGSLPIDVGDVRTRIAGLLHNPGGSLPPEGLSELARIKRAALAGLRPKLSSQLIQAMDVLRFAPILINADPRPRERTLSTLRQTERGLGDHPLTIFDTGESFAFDQSHIFFDGTWGAALAEILTNDALAWAGYLHQLPSVTTIGSRPYTLTFDYQPKDKKVISAAPRVPAEVSAESDQGNINAIIGLRKLFKRRSDLLGLTVNDLLVLYRGIHALSYQPRLDMLSELEHLKKQKVTRAAASAALDAIQEDQRTNPAILIPIDASQLDPSERLYPLVFENPLHELDLLELHTQTVAALTAYKTAKREARSTLYTEFDQLQHTYLAALAGFGEIISRYIENALQGLSTSVGAIKMVAYLPVPVQRLLDKVPHHLDMLNDLIKGREVLSNVGAVVPSSTLTRFITAKDDNERKTLVWGIITDAKGTMRISLRDFRAHVSLFEALGRQDLSLRIVEDYLETYTHGLNKYVAELHRITMSSRETTAFSGDLHAS